MSTNFDIPADIQAQVMDGLHFGHLLTSWRNIQYSVLGKVPNRARKKKRDQEKSLLNSGDFSWHYGHFTVIPVEMVRLDYLGGDAEN